MGRKRKADTHLYNVRDMNTYELISKEMTMDDVVEVYGISRAYVRHLASQQLTLRGKYLIEELPMPQLQSTRLDADYDFRSEWTQVTQSLLSKFG